MVVELASVVLLVLEVELDVTLLVDECMALVSLVVKEVVDPVVVLIVLEDW